MRIPGADDTLLIRYLLGNLTEGEQVEVEDRALADPDYLVALEAAEADLVDAYVRGELPEPDRRAFERLFLTSPARRSKVEFARTFVRVAAELRATAEPSPPEPRRNEESLVGMFRRWSSGLQFSTGLAALLCLAAGTWLVIENASMRSRVATLEAQQRENDLDRQRLQRQLTDEQNRSAGMASQLQQRQTVASAPALASLILAPGLSRTRSRVEQLTLQPSVIVAHLEVQLESRDDFSRFRAALRRSNGTEVLTLGNLIRHRIGGTDAVPLDVPASALATGGYELELQGILPDQSAQDIGFYYFRVQKR